MEWMVMGDNAGADVLLHPGVKLAVTMSVNAKCQVVIVAGSSPGT